VPRWISYTPGAVLLTLHVYGVSDALARLVGLPISASFAEVKPPQAHDNPERPVATT